MFALYTPRRNRIKCAMFFKSSTHFCPEEIIFVPTQACNLHCAHCFVPNNAQKLNIEKAQTFLRDAAGDKISRVGFSGGEPFLNAEFLCQIVKTAVECDCVFDRLMTNAVWWQSEDELKKTLQKLYNSGFDGTFGVSFDFFHGKNSPKVAAFIKNVEEIWQNRNMVSLVLVYKTLPGTQGAQKPAQNAPNLMEENQQTLALLTELSGLLDTTPFFKDSPEKAQANCPSFPQELRYGEKLENGFDDGREFDSILIEKIAFIDENPQNPDNWQSSEWFSEDFCEGPGNVYYVHANGDVAACCGYANEESKLILGNLNQMSFEEIKKAGEQSLKNGFLKTVYKTGLLKTALKMQKNGHKFPGNGKTRDNCLFCRYLCKNCGN